MKLRFILPLFIFLFIGCTSVPDLGIYNQGDEEESNLVTLVFNTSLFLKSINGERFISNKSNLWETGFTFKIPQGEYLFIVDWITGLNQWYNIDITAKLEPGKIYRVRHRVDKLVLTILITDVENNNVIQSVTREFSGVRYL